MFFKRLCDQWENEADDAIAELERQQGRTFTEKQKAKAGEMERAKNLACVNELRCAIRWPISSAMVASATGHVLRNEGWNP